MLFNEPRRRQKKQLTWRFNNFLGYNASGASKTFSATFESAGMEFLSIKLSIDPNMMVVNQMRYVSSQPHVTVSAYTINGGFKNTDYQTVAFKTEPTGELLAFLQANATPL